MDKSGVLLGEHRDRNLGMEEDRVQQEALCAVRPSKGTGKAISPSLGVVRLFSVSYILLCHRLGEL